MSNYHTINLRIGILTRHCNMQLEFSYRLQKVNDTSDSHMVYLDPSQRDLHCKLWPERSQVTNGYQAQMHINCVQTVITNYIIHSHCISLQTYKFVLHSSLILRCSDDPKRVSQTKNHLGKNIWTSKMVHYDLLLLSASLFHSVLDICSSFPCSWEDWLFLQSLRLSCLKYFTQDNITS